MAELKSLAPEGATASAGPRQARSRHRRARRRAVTLLGLLAGLVLVALALRPSPTEVEGARVVRGPLEVTVDEQGVTRVRDRYQIAAPFAGRLHRIELEAGDPVEEGGPVARLTPMPLDPQSEAQTRAQLDAARARDREARGALPVAAEALDQARRSVARARQLAAAGSISREALEQEELGFSRAEQAHAAARAQARAAAAELAAAQASLLAATPGRKGLAVLEAPASGEVLRVLEPSERVVVPGTPLLEIGDIRSLEVVVDVLSADAARIRPGAPVRIVEWGGGAPLEGTVRRVEPSGFERVSALGVEEQRVNVRVDLKEIPDRLGDGFRVEARIILWSAPDVLKVPVGALFRTGRGWSVFVVERGRARERAVELGQRGEREAEVLRGLAGGETVIVYPSERLSDGARVELAAAGGGSARTP